MSSDHRSGALQGSAQGSVPFPGRHPDGQTYWRRMRLPDGTVIPERPVSRTFGRPSTLPDGLEGFSPGDELRSPDIGRRPSTPDLDHVDWESSSAVDRIISEVEDYQDYVDRYVADSHMEAQAAANQSAFLKRSIADELDTMKALSEAILKRSSQAAQSDGPSIAPRRPWEGPSGRPFPRFSGDDNDDDDENISPPPPAPPRSRITQHATPSPHIRNDTLLPDLQYPSTAELRSICQETSHIDDSGSRVHQSSGSQLPVEDMKLSSESGPIIRRPPFHGLDLLLTPLDGYVPDHWALDQRASDETDLRYDDSGQCDEDAMLAQDAFTPSPSHPRRFHFSRSRSQSFSVGQPALRSNPSASRPITYPPDFIDGIPSHSWASARLPHRPPVTRRSGHDGSRSSPPRRSRSDLPRSFSPHPTPRYIREGPMPPLRRPHPRHPSDVASPRAILGSRTRQRRAEATGSSSNLRPPTVHASDSSTTCPRHRKRERDVADSDINASEAEAEAEMEEEGGSHRPSKRKRTTIFTSSSKGKRKAPEIELDESEPESASRPPKWAREHEVGASTALDAKGKGKARDITLDVDEPESASRPLKRTRKPSGEHEDANAGEAVEATRPSSKKRRIQPKAGSPPRDRTRSQTRHEAQVLQLPNGLHLAYVSEEQSGAGDRDDGNEPSQYPRTSTWPYASTHSRSRTRQQTATSQPEIGPSRLAVVSEAPTVPTDTEIREAPQPPARRHAGTRSHSRRRSQSYHPTVKPSQLAAVSEEEIPAPQQTLPALRRSARVAAKTETTPTAGQPQAPTARQIRQSKKPTRKKRS